jgi:hypothetical protein
MFYLFIIAVLAIFLYGVKKGFKKDSKPDEYPVTIIKDGKSVTVNGYDTAALKEAFHAAGLKTDDDAPEEGHASFRQTDIVWGDKYPKGLPYRLEYHDRFGEVTEREILLVSHSGVHANGHEYIGAIDGGKFKTFRKDRVIRLERLGG